jgi:hypothetical protein
MPSDGHEDTPAYTTLNPYVLGDLTEDELALLSAVRDLKRMCGTTGHLAISGHEMPLDLFSGKTGTLYSNEGRMWMSALEKFNDAHSFQLYSVNIKPRDLPAVTDNGLTTASDDEVLP